MLKKIICSLILGTACFSSILPLETRAGDKNNGIENIRSFNWVKNNGWIITSYGDVNEALYSEEKVEVFNKNNESLGFYRKDFLERVRINGVGVGDGILNDKTKFLHYDFEIDNGITSYLSDIPLGAYDNEIFPWNENKPSIAVNPVLPKGTRIRIIDLGKNKNFHDKWVQDLLLSKIFYADDKFFLSERDRDKKKIDIYVGLLERTDYEGPQSIYLENASIAIEEKTDLDFNKDSFFDYLDLNVFADNWLRTNKVAKAQEEYNLMDLNYDGLVDFYDYAMFADIWMERK